MAAPAHVFLAAHSAEAALPSASAAMPDLREVMASDGDVIKSVATKAPWAK